jgi:hypothetical protein
MIEDKVHRVAFDDPEAFEVGIEPVAGSVRVRPPRGSRLRGKAAVASLHRIGFMAIDAEPMTVRKDRAAGFYGLTITRGAPYRVSDERRFSAFNRDSAHLLIPDKEFDLKASDEVSLLVSNFFIDNLQDYACRLDGGTDASHLPADCRVSLTTPAGASLVRYLSFVWGELNHA